VRRPSRLLKSRDSIARALARLRRGWWLIGLLVIAGLVVAGGAWLLSETLPEAVDPTWERILETGALRVCTDPSWPPFESVDQRTGEIQGFDIDLAGVLAERLAPGTEVKARIVPVGFDGLYDALLAGRCDAVLSALPYEPMRTQDVVYSVAYFNAGLVLLTGEDTTGIRALEDLASRVVGVEWSFVPAGDTHQKEFLRTLGARRYDTAEDVLRALQSGEVEAAIVDRITALAYTGECEGLQFVGEPIYDVNYVIPVRPDSFRLLREINRVLLEMREDGTLEALQDRWF
jgi:polar amino acid transport system substrate-binding protein